jgi:predicted kinase
MNPEIDTHISRDQIRFALLNDEDEYFKVEDKVRKYFYQQIEDTTSDGYTDDRIFIDATHISAKSRRLIRNHIKARPYQIAISFEIPLNVALERNSQRCGRALVPETAIYNMYYRYEIPSLKEGFDEIWHIDEKGNIRKETR